MAGEGCGGSFYLRLNFVSIAAVVAKTFVLIDLATKELQNLLKPLVISLFLYRSSAELKGATSKPSHPEQVIRHHLWHV